MQQEDIIRIWQQLTVSHPSITQHPTTTLSRSSDVVTVACVLLTTSYVNNITEIFEGRVKYFLKYKISQKFPVRYSLGLVLHVADGS
jgi:hypothetical protein